MIFGIQDITSVIIQKVPIERLQALQGTNEPSDRMKFLLQGIFELYEQAYTKRTLALISKDFSVLVVSELNKLKENIVKGIAAFQNETDSHFVLSRSASTGYCLQVLKVYYTANPVMLNNRDKRIEEQDDVNRNMMLVVFGSSNPVVSTSFTPFIIKLNREHNLGLLDQPNHDDHWLPIHILCNRNHYDFHNNVGNTLKLLLNSECDKKHINALVECPVSYPDQRIVNTEVTPLFLLISRSRNTNLVLDKTIEPITKENILLLIKNGADVNLKNGDGDTILHICAKSYFPTYIPLFVQQGGDLELKNNNGLTPLDVVFDLFFNENDQTNQFKARFTRTFNKLIQSGAKFTPFLFKKYQYYQTHNTWDILNQGYRRLPDDIKAIIHTKFSEVEPPASANPNSIAPTSVALPKVEEVTSLTKSLLTTNQPESSVNDVDNKSSATAFGLFRSLTQKLWRLFLYPFRIIYNAIFSLFY